MIELIFLFGILILIAGLIILVNPEIILSFMRNRLNSLYLYASAVIVRILLGVLLITQSGVSKFPVIIEVLGWLSVIVALLFALIGRTRFSQLMSWALSLNKTLARIGGIFAGAFGGFLIYVFV